MIFEKLFCSQTWMYLKLARILLTTCCSNLALFNAHFFPPKKRPISILDIFSNNQKMVDPRILTCKKYILANPQKTLAEKESGIELYTTNMLHMSQKLQCINGCLPQTSVLMSCFKSVESWGTKLREKNTFNLGNL